MTRIYITQHEFNNLLQGGVNDLVSYFEGRFAEAATQEEHRKIMQTATKDYDPLIFKPSPVIPLDDATTPNCEVEVLKNRVTALEQQVTELKSTNEAVFKRLCDLENWKASMLRRLFKEARGISPNDFTD